MVALLAEVETLADELAVLGARVRALETTTPNHPSERTPSNA